MALHVRMRQIAKQYRDWIDYDFTAGYIQEYCRKETEELLKQAGELVDQTFRFTDRWDMEPCPTPYTMQNMQWDISSNGDPEWVYMLNRHDFLKKLFWAWKLTGEKRYIEKLKWYLIHWIRNNPLLPQGTETTRTIDTGIRCMNWQHLILYLEGEQMLDEEEENLLMGSLCSQFLSMRQRYIRKYTLSNWGVLQTAAICQGYLLFGEEIPGDGLEQWAWDELQRQMDLQILEDGSHWEQSIMYHMEVLLACMKLLQTADFVKSAKAQWLRPVIQNMSRYVLFAAGPDHCQIAQCDSDVTDVRDVLVKAAVLTGDGIFRFGGGNRVDLDSALLFGRPGICAYEAMKPAEPGERVLTAVDTGNLYFRSSWEEDACFTYLTCGPLGSGHGHADLTHISLYYRGMPFLVDSGRYSYREDEPMRIMLKEAQAHNVCVVDGESMGIPKGSWSYDSYANCHKVYDRHCDGVHFAEMSYHHTMQDGKLCLVIRRVMAADAGIWMIVNEILCDGEHQVSTAYHLSPEVRVAAETQQCTQWDLERDGEKLVFQGSSLFTAEQAVVSEAYNEWKKTICLNGKQSFQDRYTGWECFAGHGISVQDVPVFQLGDETCVEESVVTAKEFVLSETESWIFLIWNQETFRGGKMYLCRDIPVYTKAAAIHCLNGHRTLIRLKN